MKKSLDAFFTQLYQNADLAGRAAATACTPVPMIVGSPSTPLCRGTRGCCL